MTRINVGICPRDLCDQHLLAEYRELPRAFKKPKGKAPGGFKLGPGHVTWCAQFPGMLAERFLAIVDECQRRGFSVQFKDPPSGALDGERPPTEEVLRARSIVASRIKERLDGMIRNGHAPRWTRPNAT